MDMKTMKWLEKRLEKAKEIRKEIDNLNVYIQKTIDAKEVEFSNFKFNETVQFHVSEHTQGGFYNEVIKAMAETFKEHATKRIEQLEKEFSEL